MALAERQFDEKRGIATIVVNRPEVLNALDVPTAEAIRDAVLPLKGDARVRCVVLRGEGRAFIAGGDLARFADDFDKAGEVIDHLLEPLHAAILTLREIDAPVLASVHGAAAGAGLSLMAACDLVIAAQGTRFLLAYDRIGASPDCGGSWFLPRLLGERRAAELMLLSATWDADTALQNGLINRVVGADELATATETLAAELAAGPTRAYGHYKRLSAQAFSQPLADQLLQEQAAFKAATHTADFKAGVTAFLNRTKPTFEGR